MKRYVTLYTFSTDTIYSWALAWRTRTTLITIHNRMRRQVRSLANRNQVSIQVLFVYYKFYVICDFQVHGNTVREIEPGS